MLSKKKNSPPFCLFFARSLENWAVLGRLVLKIAPSARNRIESWHWTENLNLDLKKWGCKLRTLEIAASPDCGVHLASSTLKCWKIPMLKCWILKMLKMLKCWIVENVIFPLQKKNAFWQHLNISTFQHFQHFNISTFTFYSKMTTLQHFNIWGDRARNVVNISTFSRPDADVECWNS